VNHERNVVNLKTTILTFIVELLLLLLQVEQILRLSLP